MSIEQNRVEDTSQVQLYATEAEHADTIGLRSIGFWLYMMSDAMIFAGLFAAHGVYLGAYGTSEITAGDVINPVSALLPTLVIMVSVLFFGFASSAMARGDRRGTLRWMCATLAVGTFFLLDEAAEFTKLAMDGATPQASAFLSDFWTIVWVHGAHVFFGLIWMAALTIQIWSSGFTEATVGRFINLRIFWFFQAVIWVCVYTFVYLMGVS